MRPVAFWITPPLVYSALGTTSPPPPPPVFTVNEVTGEVAELFAVSFATTDQVQLPFVNPVSATL
jgi:hypothetical protein